MLSKEDKPIVKAFFRNFYKRATAHERDKRIHEHVNDRIIRLFIKKVVERLTNNKSGVHIKRIGYFYIHMTPFNYVTPSVIKSDKYHLAFIPTQKSIFKYWDMSFHFSQPLMQAIRKKIKEGYRYLNMVKGLTNSTYFNIGNNEYAKKQIRIKKRVLKNKK